MSLLYSLQLDSTNWWLTNAFPVTSASFFGQASRVKLVALICLLKVDLVNNYEK